MAKDKYGVGGFDEPEHDAKAPAKAASKSRAKYKVLTALSYNKDGAYTAAAVGETIDLTEAEAKRFLATGAVESAK